MGKEQIKQFLSDNPHLQKDLFIRGFLVTDHSLKGLQEFPFYGNWKERSFGKFHFYSHILTGVHFYEKTDGTVFFLLGHAYDPIDMLHEEQAILQKIAETDGTDRYYDQINHLTGVFVYGVVRGNRLEYLTDPSGMQSACSGIVDGTFYLSSHAQLIGDLCDLTMDPIVEELVAYKWYRRVMGAYLPADLTPFAELKRVVPSIAYSFADGTISHRRFWPLKEAAAVASEKEYEGVIQEAAVLLRNNMTLIAEKWKTPWISLTGGIDSNTTFAAANGNYDRFAAFSYLSAEKEIPDVEAARKIAAAFGVTHHVCEIPNEQSELKDFEAVQAILRHNNGYIAERKQNEVRKRVYLKHNLPCDVEVKSWASETIRCYWYKHYDRRTMPKLSAKLYRNLYKIFLENRQLAHKVDRLFAKYLTDYEYETIPEGYPPADMHYNEVTWGSWGGLNISEMKYYTDITIPYNNRKFYELMFRVPVEKRISDQHHLDMKKILNPELHDLGIRVVNKEETKFRAFALNVIFTINSILP